MTSSGSSKGRKSFTDFLAHIHPPTVPAETLRFTLSWGLGGMCATLILLLFCTGALQLLTYEPSIAGAYESVERMYSRAHLGGWVRNIHYWSANLLVITGVLHLLRVVMTGAVGTGRRLNWVLGLVLFALILAANFSGYLLPWDQLAFWAVTICTSMMSYIPGIGPWLMELFRGGAEVGPDTLTNFFGLHIAVIPGLMLIFMIWHFWLVRRSGGLVRAEKEPGTTQSRVPAVPDLVAREAAAGCTVIALVMQFEKFSFFWSTWFTAATFFPLVVILQILVPVDRLRDRFQKYVSYLSQVDIRIRSVAALVLLWGVIMFLAGFLWLWLYFLNRNDLHLRIEALSQLFLQERIRQIRDRWSLYDTG